MPGKKDVKHFENLRHWNLFTLTAFVWNLKSVISYKMNSLDASLYLGFKISKNDTFHIKAKNGTIKIYFRKWKRA